MVHYSLQVTHTHVVLSNLIRFIGRAVDGEADKKLRKIPDQNFQLKETASKWFDIDLRKF